MAAIDILHILKLFECMLVLIRQKYIHIYLYMFAVMLNLTFYKLLKHFVNILMLHICI